MSYARIEFAVQMTCEDCAESVKKCLEDVPQVKDYKVDLSTQTVLLNTTLRTEEAQKLIESTGRKAVVKGFDGSKAAVVVLEAGNRSIQGVIRLIQIASGVCLLDGTIDGLQPGSHNISIHECGDISDGCNMVGDIYDNGLLRDDSSKVGFIGKIDVDENGRAAFRIEDKWIRISDIIGRSLVVEEYEKRNAVVCGVIARSAGLFQNPKTICACDGVSIWDENRKRNKSSL